MADPRKEDGAGVQYKYFWLKIASKAEVLAQRKYALDNGDDEKMIFTHPLTIGINPQKKKPGMAEIHLGIAIDIKHSEAKDMLPDVMSFDAGYDYEAVREWIDSDDGRKWAGSAYCVLCYAAAETA